MQPVPITTYAFGACGSIAATIFLAGQKRVAASACMFTLHAASFIEGSRKGEISENTELISLPFRQALQWPPERIAHYFGTTKEQFLLAPQAKEFSIATDIADIKMVAGDDSVHVNIP